jgi:uncharacterized protein with ATP-grasp and redox domains
MNRPEPLRTDGSNAFARHSMQVRVPRIAREVAARGTYSAEVKRDVESLATDLEADAPVPAPKPPAADVEGWAQAYAEHAGETWLGTEWFYAELAFYRELAQRCRFWETGRDPFEAAKEEEVAGDRPLERLRLALSARGSRDERIFALLDDALWGNRVDLSYAVAASRARSDDDLIVDQRAAAVPRLASAAARVHVVVDNTGTELALDLALVAAVLEDPTAVATLHVKIEPVFVSDAMARDVWRVIGRMGEGPADTRRLSESLTRSFEDGRLRMAPDAFWSGPRFLRQAPRHISDAFRSASIVVFKGDANYRRVVGDALWPPATPLAAACSHLGAPIVCLRTMKSDPVLGLPAGLAERLDTAEPTWRVDAKRGLVETWVG